MNSTPRAERLHISIFGKRNVGKSTLINALTNQGTAVVSEIPGTTTDPVIKSMELLPIGPVVIIDTAGFDDVGQLGNLRVEKTYDVLRKTDIAILVVNSQDGITEIEMDFIKKVKQRDVGIVCVLNKCDLKQISQQEKDKIEKELGVPVISISSANKTGIEQLKNLLPQSIKSLEKDRVIVGDLVNEGDLVVLVTPIDFAAPKGRMILPQQQTIRDVIDNNAIAIVTKETQLQDTLKNLNKKPSMVITDSQAFSKVSKIVPEDIPLTSFSILFARYKGDLLELIRGVKRLKELKDGDKVLIVEGCTHHRQPGDIGKVKIPEWIKKMIGKDIKYQWASGNTIPKEICEFSLIIHCGGCMLNNREMEYRIKFAKENNVPITNYGILIAYVNGILERVLSPIPQAKNILEK